MYAISRGFFPRSLKDLKVSSCLSSLSWERSDVDNDELEHVFRFQHLFRNIREVDLSNNRLTRIPKELLDWPLLEIANFQSNNISSFKMHISVSLLIEGIQCASHL